MYAIQDSRGKYTIKDKNGKTVDVRYSMPGVTRQEILDESTIIIKPQHATGGGLSISRKGSEGWFLPAPLTRGKREATSTEIAGCPAWVHEAYEWYLGR
jgi:hypothetical protein